MRAKTFEQFRNISIAEGVKKFKGTTVKDLLKASGAKLGNTVMVEDFDGNLWSMFLDDAKPTDDTAYAMDQYDKEKELLIKSVALIHQVYDSRTIFESGGATEDYEPPRYLVLPALDPEGNQVPSDKMHKYMEFELAKRKSYFKPGIRSANPPTNGHEVEDNLENDNVEESINEALSQKDFIDFINNTIESNKKANVLGNAGKYAMIIDILKGYIPSKHFQEIMTQLQSKDDI